jgi:hypothetical protein
VKTWLGGKSDIIIELNLANTEFITKLNDFFMEWNIEFVIFSVKRHVYKYLIRPSLSTLNLNISSTSVKRQAYKYLIRPSLSTLNLNISTTSVKRQVY